MLILPARSLILEKYLLHQTQAPLKVVGRITENWRLPRSQATSEKIANVLPYMFLHRFIFGSLREGDIQKTPIS